MTTAGKMRTNGGEATTSGGHPIHRWVGNMPVAGARGHWQDGSLLPSQAPGCGNGPPVSAPVEPIDVELESLLAFTVAAAGIIVCPRTLQPAILEMIRLLLDIRKTNSRANPGGDEHYRETQLVLGMH